MTGMFPAGAGMNRHDFGAMGANPHVPRRRGDEPIESRSAR